MLSGAKVLRVLVREGRAIGVELVHGKQRLELFAGKVVLAGGGIGSARLLHASGLAKGGEPFFSDPAVTSCHGQRGRQRRG